MRNEYEVTEKLYTSWGIENMFKGIHLKLTIAWVVMAVLLFACFFVFNFDLFFIFFTAFCLYRAFIHNILITKRQYKSFIKRFCKETWKRIILFESDCIVINDEDFSTKVPYSDVVCIRQSDNKIWIDTNKKMVVRLYKNSFVDGNYEDFLTMMKTKIPDLSVKEL